jgi:hypothetical protein
MVHKELSVTVAAFMKSSEYYAICMSEIMSWPPLAVKKR